MKDVHKSYWNGVWDAADLPPALDPNKPGLRNYFKRSMHEYFKEALGDYKTQGKKLLEVGCARSQLLPYFAKEFGFEVHGLDYSEIGCEMARAILERESVNGLVYLADFFLPPENLKQQFDVVFSYGVAEHFGSTEKCLSAFAAFLRPGGLMVTIIPNMTGLVGLLQRLVNKPIFDIHKPIDASMLSQAHQDAGCAVVKCDYFFSTNFGVCNLNGLETYTVSWTIKKLLLTVLVAFSALIWFVELHIGRFRPTKALSAYVNCVATKA